MSFMHHILDILAHLAVQHQIDLLLLWRDHTSLDPFEGEPGNRLKRQHSN